MYARIQRVLWTLAAGIAISLPAHAQKIGTFVDGERPMYIELDQLVGGQPFNLEIRNVPSDVDKVVLIYSPQFKARDLTQSGIPGYLGPDLASATFASMGRLTAISGITPAFNNGKTFYLQAYIHAPSVGSRLTMMLKVKQGSKVGGTGGGPAVFPLPVISEELVPGIRQTWNRSGSHVRLGVPLPRGTVAEVGGVPQLSVTGAQGGVSQFDSLAYWPDGSVKWALVEYFTSVNSGQQHQNVQVDHGTGSTGGASIATVNGNLVTLDTGPLQVGLRSDTPDLFDSVTLAGQPMLEAANQLHFLDDQDQEWTLHVTDTVVRRNGPVRAEVQIDGRFTQTANLNDTERVYVRLYVEAIKGQSSVRVTVNLRNASRGYQKNLLFRGLYWEGQLKTTGPFRSRVSDASPDADSPSIINQVLQPAEHARYDQAFVNHSLTQLVTEPNYTDYTPFIQRTGTNKFALEGARIRVAGIDYTSGGSNSGFSPTGSYADPAFVELISDSTGQGVLLTLEHMQVNWPARLRGWGDGRFEVHLFTTKTPADTYHYPLTWGTCETRTFDLVFEDGLAANPHHTAGEFTYPVGGRCPEWVYNQADVWPWKLVSPADFNTFLAESGMKAPGQQPAYPMRTIYRFANLTGGGNNRWMATQFFYRWLSDGTGGSFWRSMYEAYYKVDKMAFNIDDGTLVNIPPPLNEPDATKKDRFYDGHKHTFFQVVPDMGFARGETYLLDSREHFSKTLLNRTLTAVYPNGNFVGSKYGAIANATLSILSMGDDPALESHIKRYMDEWATVVYKQPNGLGIDTSLRGWQAYLGTPIDSALNPDAYFVNKDAGKSSDFQQYGYNMQPWTDLRGPTLAYSGMIHYLQEHAPGDPLIGKLQDRADDWYHFSRRGFPDDYNPNTGEYFLIDVFCCDPDDDNANPFLPPGPEIQFPQTSGYIHTPWLSLYLETQPSESALSYGLEMLRSASKTTWNQQNHDPTARHFVWQYLINKGLK